jgi:hypothetical protein
MNTAGAASEHAGIRAFEKTRVIIKLYAVLIAQLKH